MWVIAAVQLIGPLRPTAAPTVLAKWLASAAVERDHRSKSTGHGKQITAAVGVPPDSKGTNRMSTVVADIIVHQQHGDQRRPELRLQGIGRSPYKRFHPQRLFQGPEKQLYLPALLVHRGDGSRRQFQVIGQKYQHAIALLIVKLDPPEVGIPARLGQLVEKDHFIP